MKITFKSFENIITFSDIFESIILDILYLFYLIFNKNEINL